VTAYPGFDRHELLSKLNGLLAAGQYVPLTWQEPIGYIPDPNVAFSGPIAVQVVNCLGTSYPPSATFEWDPLADPTDPKFSEHHAFGGPTEAVHVPQTPKSRALVVRRFGVRPRCRLG
jgi:hypothetical protein